MVTQFTIFYDNNHFDKSYECDWGFGCIVEFANKRILFDTGAKPDILLKNLETAAIDAKSIDMLVISHKHWDHKGGLSAIVGQNPELDIYIPINFSKRTEKELRPLCRRVIRVKTSGKIDEEGKLFIICSRTLFVREQSLAVKTQHGIVLLTGCSHSGIDKITQKAKTIVKSDIYALLGGFHLFKSSPKKIWKTIKGLKEAGVQNVAPCHCTGQKGFDIFKEAFHEQYHSSGVGAKFEF